jgi:hypothetical protein
MAEREYGAPRARAGWAFMSYPELPDNEPIQVLESAVPAKESRGWVVVEAIPDPLTNDADGGTWELTEDED